jgi:hypothetical protein
MYLERMPKRTRFCAALCFIIVWMMEYLFIAYQFLKRQVT